MRQLGSAIGGVVRVLSQAFLLESRGTVHACGMGPRTNCFITVAIPNTQNASYDSFMPMYRSLGACTGTSSFPPMYRSFGACTGTSYAARISVAEESVGRCDANAIDIVRPPDEPIVVTVLTYNTIEVPEDFHGELTTMTIAPTDVALCVADLDRQYELVKKNGGVVVAKLEVATAAEFGVKPVA